MIVAKSPVVIHIEAQLAAPKALPTLLVDVGKLPRVETIPDIWTTLAGVGTLAVALATIGLALYTKSLARRTGDLVKATMQSLDISRQALADDRAAQEISRQALEDQRAAVADERERHKDSFMPHISIEVEEIGSRQELTGGGVINQLFGSRLVVKNKGPGLANAVKWSYTGAPNNQQAARLPFAMSPGEERRVFNAAGLSSFDNCGYTVTYTDVFGQRFESRYIDLQNGYEWKKFT